METEAKVSAKEKASVAEAAETGHAPRPAPRLSAVEVLAVQVTRSEMKPEALEVLRELYSLDELPLAPALVEIELRGVPTAIVNGIRRAAMDEMQGHALAVPVDGMSIALTTDEFALPQFISNRIELMPLRPRLSAELIRDLRLRLDVTNTGATARNVHSGDLEVVAGALTEPIFNPTFELAFLQPGRRLVIEGIQIRPGYGRDSAVFNVARRGAYTHLDLEQYTDDEMRRAGGAAVDLSGYKTSCLVADPRHHRLRYTAPAVGRDPAEAASIAVGACASLEDRLRLVISTVDRRAEADTLEGNSSHRGLQCTVARLSDGLYEARLLIPGESTSIGEIICRTIHDLTPDVAYVANFLVNYENRLSIVLRHREDVTQVILAALHHAVATLAQIRQAIQGWPF